MYKVGIIGYGVVGKAYHKLFPNAVIYDKYIDEYSDKSVLNNLDFALICVPTPMKEDKSCDTSIVEEVVSWLEAKVIIIKSTVSVGTTDRLRKKYHKLICFSPEYIGESPTREYKIPGDEGFVILGGEKRTTSKAAELFKSVYNPKVKIIQTDAITAELTKYVENTWLACKVVFCNEIYRIAKKLNIDYNELRELWLLDRRVNRSHTFVYEESPYYDSKCLNKDVPALVRIAEKAGYNPKFIKSIIECNERFKNESALYHRRRTKGKPTRIVSK